MDWKSLITSSADPQKVSLFIKSIAALAVLWGFDATIVNQAGNELANLLTAVAMGISAVTALLGLYRKANLGRWSAM